MSLPTPVPKTSPILKKKVKVKILCIYDQYLTGISSTKMKYNQFGDIRTTSFTHKSLLQNKYWQDSQG